MHNEKTFEYKWLMLTTLVISGCSIIYEVLISSVSAYLVGDSIKQFSITIGLYMSAMGIGSYLSKYIKKHLFDWFVWVELGVGVLGGVSSFLLFMAYSYLDVYTLVMYGEILAIGTLVGLEIPLLTRIIEENTKDLRMTISHLFSFDYIGGLVGSIAFPLFLLPQYGYFTTAALVGTLNIIIALFIIFKYRSHIRFFSGVKWIGIITLIGMVLAALFSENVANQIEDGMYRDHIIYKEQTPYQYLVMTKHKDDVRLFINGNIQFSSVDEYRYHESLVHIPMSVAKEPKKVLILGGGDGLAIREVLKYESVEEVTLVDLDEEMVALSSTHHEIVALNEGALLNEKVTCVYEDAFKFLEETSEVYDVILVDLPDPNDEGLNKLYTNVFYRLCGNKLSPTGAMSIQATSPYYAKEAFWCVYKTLKEEGFFVEPYHVQVPTFGDWGFQLVTKQVVDKEAIKVEQPTKFLNEEVLPNLFGFAEDQKLDLDLIESNTLTHPKLIMYYLKAVENWR
ncbi:MAG: polyamine aminopropyltransferase [Cellulosilyticaceae bacterium]